jgi:hypothetical protein
VNKETIEFILFQIKIKKTTAIVIAAGIAAIKIISSSRILSFESKEAGALVSTISPLTV